MLSFCCLAAIEPRPSKCRSPLPPVLLSSGSCSCIAALQAFPDNDAVVSVHQGVRLSYRQFHEQVEEAARGLLALGIQVRLL